MENKMKIAVFCQQGLEEFVQPIINSLREQHEVRLSNGQSPEEAVGLTRWADVVWLEWGNEMAIKMTRAQGVLDNVHTIMRVHSYEIFAKMLHQIRWGVVDQLICPSMHTMDLAMNASDMGLNNMHRIRQSVIPSGVDLKKFTPSKHQHGDNIAFVARLNHKKGIELMLQVVMQQLGFQYHIAGVWQDMRLQNYFEHMVKLQGLQDIITFHGWVEPDDMVEWLSDKDYILSTSPFESQGMGIMEAMAQGIKPLVHWFPGAEENFPKDCLWTDTGDLAHLLSGKYDSNSYRAHIEKNFSLTQVLKKVNRIMPGPDEIQSAKQGQVLSPLATNSEQTSTPQGETHENQGGGTQGSYDHPVRLAVALMFKDDEADLTRCLASIKPFADVIVGMDTGSQDSSNSILESFDASVHLPTDLGQLYTETEHGPKLMFGPARNRLLSYVPDDIDWVLLIDCDEEFIDGIGVKEFLSNLEPTYNAVAINMKDMQGGEVVMDFNTTKMFRRGMVHYENIVHNEPVFEGYAALIPGAHMLHFGYDLPPHELEAKKHRTIGLIDRRIADNPKDWKAYFYKGQALGFYDPTNLAGIVETTKVYVDHRAELADFNLSAYFTLIKALMNLGEVEESWRYILEARASMPDDLDIAMAMLEFGVWTKQDMLISTGAAEFLRIYALYEKDPSKKGGRFIYSHNPQALVFVTFYETTSQLRRGAKSLEHLVKLSESIPAEQRVKLMGDIDAALAGTGVSLVQGTTLQ